MIVRVSGIVELVEGNRAVLLPDSAPGQAWELLTPAYLAERLRVAAANASPITLHTLSYFEQVGQGTSFIPRLIGFGSHREREWFELFTTVKGLGNKRALRAMAMPPHAVARWIDDGDLRALTRLPEIGKKLAETILLELKDKAAPFASDEPPAAAPAATVEPKSTSAPRSRRTDAAPTVTVQSGAVPSADLATFRRAQREAVEALIALGEIPMDAERMVGRAVEKARASGGPLPSGADAMITLAYAARTG